MTFLLTEAGQLAICNASIQAGWQWGIIPILEMGTEATKSAVASAVKEAGKRVG